MKNKYLKTAQNLHVNPNFWMSDEYLKAAEAVDYEQTGFSGVRADGLNLFPELMPPPWGFIKRGGNPYWASPILRPTMTNVITEENGHTFLDYNFLYRPSDLAEAKGGKFKKFRKNSRRVEKSHFQITGDLINTPISLQDIDNFVIEWVESKAPETVQDGDSLVNFFFNAMATGEGIGIVAGRGEIGWEIIGINLWDENWRYVNYRYCLANHGIPYADEFLRRRFYSQIAERVDKKWVNDGGSIDSEGLHRFKMSLNPVRVERIYSYKGDPSANKEKKTVLDGNA